MAFMKYFALIVLIAIALSNKIELQNIEPQINFRPQGRDLQSMEVNDPNVLELMKIKNIDFAKLMTCLEPLKSDFKEIWKYIIDKNSISVDDTLEKINYKEHEITETAKECIQAATLKK